MNLLEWTRCLRAALRRQEGQTMAEYGVVLAVISVAVILVIGALSLTVGAKLSSVTSVLAP